MPGNPIDLAEQSIAITDPGEKNREEHLWGDRLMIQIGNIMAWIFPILMVAIVTQVIIRKMGLNQAWLDDAQWWLYGVAMLTGFGYAITTESHVRVDILHQYFPPDKKAKIELFGLGWFLLPFLVMMCDVMFHYAYSSWVAGEGSDSANGLHRLYLLKMLLPILFVVSAIAAISTMQRHLTKLTTPTLWKFIIASFPALWFAVERVCVYVFYGYIRYTQPDIVPRRIKREPLMDYAPWVALAVVVLLFLWSYYKSRNKTARA